MEKSKLTRAGVVGAGGDGRTAGLDGPGREVAELVGGVVVDFLGGLRVLELLGPGLLDLLRLLGAKAQGRHRVAVHGHVRLEVLAHRRVRPLGNHALVAVRHVGQPIGRAGCVKIIK